MTIFAGLTRLATPVVRFARFIALVGATATVVAAATGTAIRRSLIRQSLTDHRDLSEIDLRNVEQVLRVSVTFEVDLVFGFVFEARFDRLEFLAGVNRNDAFQFLELFQLVFEMFDLDQQRYVLILALLEFCQKDAVSTMHLASA